MTHHPIEKEHLMFFFDQIAVERTWAATAPNGCNVYSLARSNNGPSN